MSVLQHPVQPRSFAVPASLNRLLLLCRFDFRQRNWNLPLWEIHRDSNCVFPAQSAALASAISKNLSDFFDPSSKGVNPSKSANNRIVIRHSLRRSFEKTNHQKKGNMKYNCFHLPAVLLGKILFPHRQTWQREREAKLILAATLVALVFAGIVGAVAFWRNGMVK